MACGKYLSPQTGQAGPIHKRTSSTGDRDVIDAPSNAMTTAIDIYRAAKLYIDQHGDQATLQAAGNLG